MVEYKDLFTYSTISILLISTILGFMPEPNDNYVCLSLNITKYCDRLSSTNKTCYPNPDTTVGKKYCSSGWIPIFREPENNTIIEKVLDNTTIKVPLRAGGILECPVIDGVLDNKCYFNNRPTYRSEFEKIY